MVLKPPADQDVSVVAFTTGDYYDERKALATRMESSIVRGGLYIGYLWGDHIIGQRAVVLWQRLSTDLPVVGQRLELVARASSVTTHSQVLWITRIIEETIERVDAQGIYQVRQVVCEIAEPLLAGYTGCEPTRIDPTTQSANGTLIYETRYNPDAVATVGVSPLAEAASLGDFSLKVNSLYSPLIPTAFAETALADINPGGETAALVPASDGTVTWSTTTDTVGPNKSLYVGGPVMPGGFSMVVSGSTITDSAGLLKLGTTDIGTIDYSNGICLWTSACPNLRHGNQDDHVQASGCAHAGGRHGVPGCAAGEPGLCVGDHPRADPIPGQPACGLPGEQQLVRPDGPGQWLVAGNGLVLRLWVDQLHDGDRHGHDRGPA